MAAPLSGAGQQQQVPASQAFQPLNADDSRNVKRQEQNPREDQLQVKEAPAAQSQRSDSSSDSTKELEDTTFKSLIDNSETSESRGRGSVIDLQI
tara:strand:+ start:9077 stop:9361 length:285 start_codon:yes stop_codon:yes gene_type:complete